MTDSDLIDAFGGTSAVARLFEIRPPSVSEWRNEGIPKARRQTMRVLRPDLFIRSAERPRAEAVAHG